MNTEAKEFVVTVNPPRRSHLESCTQLLGPSVIPIVVALIGYFATVNTAETKGAKAAQERIDHVLKVHDSKIKSLKGAVHAPSTRRKTPPVLSAHDFQRATRNAMELVTVPVESKGGPILVMLRIGQTRSANAAGPGPVPRPLMLSVAAYDRDHPLTYDVNAPSLSLPLVASEIADSGAVLTGIIAPQKGDVRFVAFLTQSPTIGETFVDVKLDGSELIVWELPENLPVD